MCRLLVILIYWYLLNSDYLYFCVYLCLFVVSLTLPFKYVFFQLATWHLQLLGYFGRPATLSSVVSICYVYCCNHGVK